MWQPGHSYSKDKLRSILKIYGKKDNEARFSKARARGTLWFGSLSSNVSNLRILDGARNISRWTQ
jgi:hypothetical protein